MVRSERSPGVQSETGTTPSLRISLLGNVQVRNSCDGSQVNVPRRTLALLAYLLLHRGQPVSREHLASVFWPDDDEPRGRARLRSHLHALARSLPSPAHNWLVADVETVAWNDHAALWLDISEFERFMSDPETLQEAVALYCGDLATGLDDDWLQPERNRYRRLFLTALESLLATHRGRRRFDAAIACGERLLEFDPWREDVVRRLIAIRYESGDRAGALAEFERFAQRLRSEMATDPMPETRVVRDAVAQGAGLNDTGAPPEHMASRNGKRPAFPFVGRAEELDALIGGWNRAAAGSGGVILMSGEAGIGKSRLAEELVHHVEATGGRVLRGSAGCPETTPYQCFVEAIRSAMPLVATIDLAPIWLGTLAILLPELHERVRDVPPQPKLDPERERQRLFEAIVRTILAFAKPRPLLLVLEDLHWADEATISALLLLARRAPLAPVLIVATHRDGETPATHPLRRLRRELQSLGLMQRLTPPPLDLADVTALVSKTANFGAAEAAELARSFHDRSEGNALFLTHLIQARLDDRLQDSPQALHALVAAQLERLAAPARALAEIGALIGHQFSTELLEEITGWDARAVANALDVLIERRIVREVSSVGDFEYDFTHQLVRLAIAETVPSTQARRRHQRIALVLERLYPDRSLELAPALARHLEAAGDAAAAAQQYLQAGRHAVEIGAPAMAFEYYARGLELSDDVKLRTNFLLERETLHGRRGEREAQRNDLAELERVAAEESDADLRCDIFHRKFRLAFAVGEQDEQARNLAALGQSVREGPTSRWNRVLWVAEAEHLRVLGRFDEAAAAARMAVMACDDATRLDLVDALCLAARIESVRGMIDESQRLLDEAARSADTPASARRVLEQRANHAILHDDYVGLEDVCAQLSVACRSVGDRKGEATALSGMGIALMRLDRYGESLAHFDAAGEICAEIDDRSRAATILVNRSHLDMTLGSLAEAAAALEKALVIHEELRDFAGLFACVDNLSAIHAYMGDGPGAREYALEALKLANQGNSSTYEATALENLAEAEGVSGNYPAAIAAMAAALGRRREIGSSLCIGWGLALMSIWYARLGDLQSARTHIATMLASEDTIRIGNAWPQYCYWAAAQIYHLSGDAADADRLLDRASELMMEQARNCPTPERRDAFMALAWHRDIAAARHSGIWPEL